MRQCQATTTVYGKTDNRVFCVVAPSPESFFSSRSGKQPSYVRSRTNCGPMQKQSSDQQAALTRQRTLGATSPLTKVAGRTTTTPITPFCCVQSCGPPARRARRSLSLRLERADSTRHHTGTCPVARQLNRVARISRVCSLPRRSVSNLKLGAHTLSSAVCVVERRCFVPDSAVCVGSTQASAQTCRRGSGFRDVYSVGANPFGASCPPAHFKPRRPPRSRCHHSFDK